VPFALPVIGAERHWVRVLDTVEAQAEEQRFSGGASYPLQGRTVALFALNIERRQRRATDLVRAV
jgi:hypothetical protein